MRIDQQWKQFCNIAPEAFTYSSLKDELIDSNNKSLTEQEFEKLSELEREKILNKEGNSFNQNVLQHLYQTWIKTVTLNDDIPSWFYWKSFLPPDVATLSKKYPDFIILIWAVIQYSEKYCEINNIEIDKFELDLFDFADYFLEDNLPIDFDWWYWVGAIFQFLYLLNITDNLKDIIKDYMAMQPETCDIILFQEYLLGLPLSKHFSEQKIKNILNELNTYLHENFYGRNNCEIIFEDDQFLLVDKNYTSIEKRRQLEGSKNLRHNFLEEVSKAKKKYNLSYKKMAETFGWNYSTFNDYRNKPTKSSWSEETVQKNLTQLLSYIGGTYNG